MRNQDLLKLNTMNIDFQGGLNSKIHAHPPKQRCRLQLVFEYYIYGLDLCNCAFRFRFYSNKKVIDSLSE